jgi:acetylornithine deacetylase
MPPTTAPPTALTLLRDLVAIPSLSGEEAEAADYVEEVARTAGVDVLRHDDNVAFGIGDGPDTLLLNSHLDVVPPSADHPYDPFTPVVEDGVLFGRGSVDAKASGAAMTAALLQLANDGWRPAGGRLLVALTACEEGGGRYNGLQALRPHLPALDAAVVGEPTGLRPCVAQKGLLILKVHAHGAAAHAGRPEAGTNAIPRAAEAVQVVDALTLDRADPHLGTPTVTVTTIEGGTARNAVPDHCVFAVDLRTTPAYTHAEITATVQDALADLDGIEVEVHSDRLVPCATPPESRIQAACEAAGTGAPFGSPTASDWVFLHDVPTVKLGPGDSTRSHTATERIPVDAVDRATTTYRHIAQHYFEAH